MKNFASFDINPAILKVLEGKGINTPTEIQMQTIPVLLKHKGDFVGRSATGTGKTYAFGCSLLSRINTNEGKIQAVVLVPTRELCEQVGNELTSLAEEIYSLKIEAIYGGVPLKNQIHELSNGVQVVVATPGRLTDLIRRKVVNLSYLDYIVFDEADEMLLKGFRTDIDEILSNTNRSYATWLFSATMPDEISGIIKKYLTKELVKIQVGKKKKTNQAIEHCALEVNPEEKLSVLLHHLTRYGEQKGIVFCRTKSGVQKLYKQLSANKFTCGAIHGDLPQGLRNKVMEQYREGHIHILIATDVAARGVDVEDIAYVVQYHVPDTADAFVHRSGRTSRVGNTGVNMTLFFPDEAEKLTELEEVLNIEIQRLALPSEKDQIVNRAILWARKVAKQKSVLSKLEEESLTHFKEELSHLSKDELLEKILATKLREIQGA